MSARRRRSPALRSAIVVPARLCGVVGRIAMAVLACNGLRKSAVCASSRFRAAACFAIHGGASGAAEPFIGRRRFYRARSDADRQRAVALICLAGFGIAQNATALSEGATALFVWRMITGVFLAGAWRWWQWAAFASSLRSLRGCDRARLLLAMAIPRDRPETAGTIKGDSWVIIARNRRGGRARFYFAVSLSPFSLLCPMWFARRVRTHRLR